MVPPPKEREELYLYESQLINWQCFLQKSKNSQISASTTTFSSSSSSISKVPNTPTKQVVRWVTTHFLYLPLSIFVLSFPLSTLSLFSLSHFVLSFLPLFSSSLTHVSFLPASLFQSSSFCPLCLILSSLSSPLFIFPSCLFPSSLFPAFSQSFSLTHFVLSFLPLFSSSLPSLSLSLFFSSFLPLFSSSVPPISLPPLPSLPISFPLPSFYVCMRISFLYDGVFVNYIQLTNCNVSIPLLSPLLCSCLGPYLSLYFWGKENVIMSVVLHW